jgi:tRNA (guanine-N7-)-methyltransferase
MTMSANTEASLAVAGDAAALPPQRHIRTFKPRRGRITAAQTNALDRLWPRWGFEIPAEGEPLDLAALFGRAAPLQLEIGCGMGDAVVAMAAAQPEHDFLAVDVHTPGLGNVLRMAERAGLTNVRAAAGDALDLLRSQLPSDSLEVVHVYFPDPWPKARHHKRRLIQAETLADLARVLRPGGRLRFATDWADYADWTLERALKTPGLTWTSERADDWRIPPADHVTTRYEQKRLGDCEPVFLEFGRN